jgi:hypothetical protein
MESIMAGTATWTFTAGDVEVKVVATIVGGEVVFNFEVVKGTADLNGAFFDWMGDGGSVKNVEGEKANNMNGSDSDGNKILGFDEAVKLGSVGGNDKDYTEGEVKFDLADIIENLNLGPNATDAEVLQALAENTIIGIRATSVGEDREGSLKMTATGDYDPGNGDDCTDHFPDLERDISYVNFVFKLNDDASDDAEALDRNGDGYVTVKIEIPEGYDATDCANNLDSWYKDALAAIYEEYPVLETDATEVGAFIKGGNNLFEAGANVWSHGSDNNIAYFAYDDDPGNDPLPDGFKTDVNGNIVATGQPANRYDDGNSVAFDPTWVPEECECIDIA